MGILEFLSLRVRTPDVAKAEGGTVTAEGAASVYFKGAAIATAVSYKANALALSTIRVFDCGKEVRDNLWYKLNYSPNPNQNASQFWNRLMEQLCLRKEALVVPWRGSFYVADAFHQQVNPGMNNTFDGVSVECSSLSRTFRANQCMYFRLNDNAASDFVDGALDEYSKLMGAAISAYKASRGQKYKLSVDWTPTGDLEEERKNREMVAQNLKAFISNANAVYLETRGQTLTPVKNEGSGAPEPSEITALRKEIYDSAAVAFKIPKSVMYGDMTNMGDLVNTMLTFTVDPEAQMLSDELTRKNFSENEVRSGSRVKVDTTTIKHIDIFDVSTACMSLISSGVYTIDDVLEALGRERVNDEITSARLMTKNLGAIEDVLRQLAQGGEQQ